MRNLISSLLLIALAAPVAAENHAIEGLTDVIFLDNYSPLTVSLSAGESVTVLDSNVRMDANDPASLMQHVIMFQATYSTPCGYFFPIAVGESVTSANSYVKLFIPLDTTTPSGFATVRVGSQVVIVDAVANGIPVADAGEPFVLPAGFEGAFSVFDSNLSFGGGYGGSLDVNKVVFFVPGAATAGDWVNPVCLGEPSLYVAPAPVDRMVHGFVVDHVEISDNSGAILVNFEASAAIATEGSSWGDVKARYR